MLFRKPRAGTVEAALNEILSVVEYDVDGNILTANGKFSSLLGYDSTEIKNLPSKSLFGSKNTEIPGFHELMETLRQGKPHTGECLKFTKSGYELWMQACYSPTLDKNGNLVKVTEYAIDFTELKLKNIDYAGQIDAIDKSQSIIEFSLDGAILHANANFLSTMDYSLEEIKGKHHSIFVDPDYAKSEEYTAFWKQLGQGKHFSDEFQRTGKNGRKVWVQASYNPIFDARGKPCKVIKYATDVTDRKFQDADFRGQIEAIDKSQAVIHFDMDGTILDANENFLSTMGYCLDEIKGKHHSMFVDPAIIGRADYKAFWEKLGRGEYLAGEFQRFGKKGKEVWIQASYNPILDMKGRPFKVVKYATDITDRKFQNADYRGQIEAIGKSQAVIEFDLDGTVCDANENFLTALGYRLQEIKGKHHRMFVDPVYAKTEDYKTFWEKLRNGEYLSGEFERIGKDGKSVWIQASYNPILDMSGNPFKIVKYAVNISDQMAARMRAADLSSDNEEKVQSVAGATQQMQAAIEEISQNMNKSQQAVIDIVSKTDQARELTMRLQETSKSMENVVEIIRAIAGKVNLLALNATIEAARAGDAGKGFAVVAGEVKSLATQTAKATDDIYQEIIAMQAVADDVVNSNDVISSATGSVNEYVAAVASAIEEQSMVTNDISKNMEHFTIGITELNDCVKRLSSKG